MDMMVSDITFLRFLHAKAATAFSAS